MRAAIYCRISEDRGGGGLGVQRQEQDCQALCERNGWAVVAVHVDNDTSAFTGTARPGWDATTELIRAGGCDVLVAWHPDRLTRRMVDLETLIALVESADVRVATVTAGTYDLATPSGRMVARNLGTAANYESEHKAERIRRKHLELAAAGKIAGGGRRPFGYGPDRLTIRADEADLIRTAVTDVLGGSSLRWIVRRWQQAGVPTVTGAEWSSTTLKRLLTSARIAGLRSHHGEITATAVWPAIITRAEHERVVAVLGRRYGPGRAQPEPRSYLLGGLMFCGRCGARMSVRPTTQGRRRYVCTVDRHGGCGRCGIDAEHTETELFGRLLTVIDDVPLRAAVTAHEAVETSPMARALTVITDGEEALTDLAADHYAAKLIGKAEFLAARKAITARIDQARAELARIDRSGLRAEWHGHGAALAAAWPGMDFSARRGVMLAWVERVDVAAYARSLGRFDPDRLTVTWRA